MWSIDPISLPSIGDLWKGESKRIRGNRQRFPRSICRRAVSQISLFETLSPANLLVTLCYTASFCNWIRAESTCLNAALVELSYRVGKSAASLIKDIVNYK